MEKINQIQVVYKQTKYSYKEYYHCIDGKTLVEYLEEQVSFDIKNKLKYNGDFLGLMPAWSGKLIMTAENRFVWSLIDSEEELNVPVLVCEDDCDLTCIVIVAHIQKTNTNVYWDKIGLVDWSEYDRVKECESGLLFVEAYTQKDWDLYGGDVAWMKARSSEFTYWLHDTQCWEEEHFRRLSNYMKSFIQKDNHINWLLEPKWNFLKNSYNNMVEEYRKIYQYVTAII